MKYYNPYTDNMGCVHSIDMVYCEYFCFYSPEIMVDKFREFNTSHPDLEYTEMLDRACHSKYSYYKDAVRFSGVFIEFGRYNNYDKATKTFDLLPMLQIRFNPNKYMDYDWFSDLLSLISSCCNSGRLRKYDYAIDLPVPMNAVQLFDCRREPGLFKGTRYYGQQGRHGYIKIYDKYKDMFRQGIVVDVPLTRVEQTLFNGQPLRLEKIYIMDNNLITDYSSLKDTERAIVEMYSMLMANNLHYDLNLGRKMSVKLKPYLYGGYKLIDYSNILDLLLSNLCKVLHADMLVTDSDGFISIDSEDELLFT